MKRDAGLTLIELVAAMAIFALVAVMGLQSLTGMLRNRDRLAEIDAQSSEMTLALARLRNDLSATVPMLFFPPERQPPRSALYQTSDKDVFSVSIGAQQTLDGRHRPHRAQWRFDRGDQSLHRRVWTALTPADASALQPEVLVMRGVTGFDLRSHWPETGWTPGLTNPATETAQPDTPDSDSGGGAPEVYSDILPDAIEITLQTDAYGSLILIESFK